MKYSVIDIGSNSVRLMTWADGTTLYKRLFTTRLGEGLAFASALKPEAIERTARAIAEFCAVARGEGASVHAFATAAVRSAKNGGQFCARVKELCGLEVDVVSGETEAELALCGALGNRDGAVVDIGGASTEICARSGGVRSLAVSLEIGAVRLYDRCRDDRAALGSAVREALLPLGGVSLPQPVYAVGGTATALAAVMQGLDVYEGEKINDFPMEIGQLGALSERLLGMSAAERANLKGMDFRRADIIAGGALLLKELMQTLRLGRIFASDRDNLEGYLARRIL